MKLELKHLAPYLPYGLKWSYKKSIYNTAYLSTKRCAIINTNGIGDVEKWTWNNIQKKHKPILRPLSELTKNIEYNGEKINPLNEVLKMFQFYDKIIFANKDEKYIELSGYGMLREMYSIDMLPYDVACKFFEWNFDVFGLIDKGLAVDVNTINA